MELLKNVSNIKNGGSKVKPPTLGGKKQAVQAQDLLFRGFDFKTCWEACAAYYPTTVVIDGPEVRNCSKRPAHMATEALEEAH